MKFQITIPDWSDGCPLRITNIKADNKEAAIRQVVEWVNQRAGYHYCDDLPPGTKVALEDK